MYPPRPLPRKKKRSPLQFTATCAIGLETLVSEEITAFGGEALLSRAGAVSWSGNLETGYRACLWSRFASRILLELSQFDAPDTDSVYNHAGDILWDDHFTASSTFAVHTTLVDATLSHSQFASLRVKDAIVDQFRKRFGKRPDVNPQQPDIRINLHVRGSEASLSLDLSGESLHRRGYRTGSGEAPLKETLAAALVRLSGWPDRVASEPVLLDPMCGGGTLLIEAALMFSNSPPGLLRKTFGFMGWNKHDHQLWERLVQEALELEGQSIPECWPRFIGYDADPKAVAAARKNVIAAGLRDVVIIKQGQLAHLRSPAPRGCLLTNPPYGDRLSEKETVKYLYRCIGRIFREQFQDWTLGVFTANPDLADGMGMVWEQRHRLFNGPIPCRLLTGRKNHLVERPPAVWIPKPLQSTEPGQDLANRLLKNCAAILPWAQREQITCFRVYDGDIPEFNLAVDLYEEWVHVQEYAPPSSINPQKARERFSLALQVIRTVFDVPRSRVFIKTRQKQKGSQQYQKKPGSGTLYEVREGGARFLVNFTDYLDTGLFLDHRITRARLGMLSRSRSFLNLFAYTGSATVYAALGGAIGTTTVDISESYLGRARANLALNGFGGPLHQTVAADCLEWLKSNRERYGVIFLDPPTFSNARHRKQTFSVQNDHSTLIRLAMQHLSRSGVLIFSTNYRHFTMNEHLFDQYEVVEISDQTLPRDFQRNRRIHRCWEFRHQQQQVLEAEQEQL
ncbi:bifunctional 23S rRNA (guanine(2069)-N(7))-methyltransferase RlmK/23S rRNA (guanine(2445)-N(2))-methyltransferase RlmL [Desulfobulbus alkaliphilus]|uniref:bifunctional 23S rRNA (guanine(2069)-N(7))-methyltransferase RlmK/23S rRNA (guanine(2445)-N(2))-methyltransferase RlmL n=1 Tax=Desulfobulbus alkaliphilus TaxID=869814 RepID=UPI001966516C|nr:bifunctional 23S rRNA (guanine(2069)-N(7))-methyltransferase RlmK/23S rRNA (guanine(2445)-N(2))-methyltransferase RlmL [Desulfobulbus alkaliphilus]MBM9535864.1 bifunctional 23S rRNA (guanine(2069)-N(7))-methyltransferase RlmK/23S rRNA (guanine(2445)-N(2))-methyltransferase RlmL [Desulfobulbus alkaliphilus]